MTWRRLRAQGAPHSALACAWRAGLGLSGASCCAGPVADRLAVARLHRGGGSQPDPAVPGPGPGKGGPATPPPRHSCAARCGSLFRRQCGEPGHRPLAGSGSAMASGSKMPAQGSLAANSTLSPGRCSPGSALAALSAGAARDCASPGLAGGCSCKAADVLHASGPEPAPRAAPAAAGFMP